MSAKPKPSRGQPQRRHQALPWFAPSLLPLLLMPLASWPAALAAQQEPQQAPQQQAGPSRRIALRVVGGFGAGQAVVDRGGRDRVEVGDRVELRTMDGQLLRGTVRRLDDRTSVVALADPAAIPRPGTPGVVWVPDSRFGKPVAGKPEPQRPDPNNPAQQTQPGGSPDAPEQPAGERPPARWSNPDTGYEAGDPLLSTRSVRPNQRPMSIRGRAYVAAQLTDNPESDFDESFLRVGAELSANNAFGYGGELHSVAEINHRTEFNDADGTNLNVRRLSYRIGGTRFEPRRLEVGRFLQYGMPEFGVLDGAEVVIRRNNGNTFGASLGFMPIPNDDFDTAQDFQLAAFHQWNFDEGGRSSAAIGFQQTIHEGKLDRDLFVFRADHLPEDAWQYRAVAFLDLYIVNDDIRSETASFSQVQASANRVWRDGDSLRFEYRRLALPELDRDEFLPIPPNELAEDHNDQLSAEYWLQWDRDTTLRTFAMVFADEGATGGAAEVELRMDDWLARRSTSRVAVLVNHNEFNDLLGARVAHRWALGSQSIELFYQLGYVQERDFPSNLSDFIQHRVRATGTFTSQDNWDLSLYGEANLIQQEIAWSLGMFFQVRF